MPCTTRPPPLECNRARRINLSSMLTSDAISSEEESTSVCVLQRFHLQQDATPDVGAHLRFPIPGRATRRRHPAILPHRRAALRPAVPSLVTSPSTDPRLSTIPCPRASTRGFDSLLPRLFFFPRRAAFRSGTTGGGYGPRRAFDEVSRWRTVPRRPLRGFRQRRATATASARSASAKLGVTYALLLSSQDGPTGPPSATNASPPTWAHFFAALGPLCVLP